MRIKLSVSRIAIACAVAMISCLTITNVLAQGGGRSGQPNVSLEERNLGMQILSAPDPATKLKLTAELIKKYPKTALRPRAARELANYIAGIGDATQKISLAQDYQKIFTEPSEQEMIIGVLIDGYAAANKIDDAFSAGSEFLTKNPDSVRVLIALVGLGTDQAKLKNGKFVAQSLQYGAKAIELIEGNKKPANLDDAAWKEYQTKLPAVYQSVGLLYLLKGNRSEARAPLIKASELAPTDPFNYLLLSGVFYDEYQDLAKHYQAMSAGQPKTDELQKVLVALDKVIDSYAHLIALAEGNEKLQPMRQQYLHDLESYYKYRHNNSTEGMQQLIDKYKTTAK